MDSESIVLSEAVTSRAREIMYGHYITEDWRAAALDAILALVRSAVAEATREKDARVTELEQKYSDASTGAAMLSVVAQRRLDEYEIVNAANTRLGIRLHDRSVERDALRDEVVRLRERVSEDNAVCLCGCPPDRHEMVDGSECCGDDEHDCLRVAPAVAEVFGVQRADLDAARKAIEEARELFERTIDLETEAQCACTIRQRDEVKRADAE